MKTQVYEITDFTPHRLGFGADSLTPEKEYCVMYELRGSWNDLPETQWGSYFSGVEADNKLCALLSLNHLNYTTCHYRIPKMVRLAFECSDSLMHETPRFYTEVLKLMRYGLLLRLKEGAKFRYESVDPMPKDDQLASEQRRKMEIRISNIGYVKTKQTEEWREEEARDRREYQASLVEAYDLARAPALADTRRLERVLDESGGSRSAWGLPPRRR